MILYHGSNIIIDVIDLTKSKRYKDFGQAFYLSSEKEQAYKMAIAKVVQFGGEEAVTSFELDESCLSSSELNVLCFTEYSREWAEFVFNNRDENQDFYIHMILYMDRLLMIILVCRFVISNVRILHLNSFCQIFDITKV